MTIRSFFKPRALYLAALLTVILALSAGAVYAATLVIDTIDDSIAEWGTQSIPVFLTDPSGDHVTTIGSTMDIINAWVERGNSSDPAVTNPNAIDRMFFRIETNAGPALQDPNSQYSRVLAAVVLDCNNNGVDNEHVDRIIGYVSPQTNPQLCPIGDNLVHSSGDLQYAAPLTPLTYPSTIFGQRPTTADTNIEWSVPVFTLNNTGIYPGAIACGGGTVKMRFATYYMNDCPPTALTEHDTTSVRSFNIPTSVELISFVDGRPQASPWFLGGMGALALLLAGLVLAGRKYNGFRA